MTLPLSGPLSLSDIAAEFGGTPPDSLFEYYGVAAGIPGSGEISIGDFYGAANVPNVNFPGQWTQAVAGQVWTQSLIGSGAPSFASAAAGFKTSYIGVGGRLWLSGSFYRTIHRHRTISLAVEANTAYRLTFNKVGITQDYMGQGTGGAYVNVYLYRMNGAGNFSGMGWIGGTGNRPFVSTSQVPFSISQSPNGLVSYGFTTPSATLIQIMIEAQITRTQTGSSVVHFSDIYLERV